MPDLRNWASSASSAPGASPRYIPRSATPRGPSAPIRLSAPRQPGPHRQPMLRCWAPGTPSQAPSSSAVGAPRSCHEAMCQPAPGSQGRLPGAPQGQVGAHSGRSASPSAAYWAAVSSGARDQPPSGAMRTGLPWEAPDGLALYRGEPSTVSTSSRVASSRIASAPFSASSTPTASSAPATAPLAGAASAKPPAAAKTTALPLPARRTLGLRPPHPTSAASSPPPCPSSPLPPASPFPSRSHHPPLFSEHAPMRSALPGRQRRAGGGASGGARCARPGPRHS